MSLAGGDRGDAQQRQPAGRPTGRPRRWIRAGRDDAEALGRHIEIGETPAHRRARHDDGARMAQRLPFCIEQPASSGRLKPGFVGQGMMDQRRDSQPPGMRRQRAPECGQRQAVGHHPRAVGKRGEQPAGGIFRGRAAVREIAVEFVQHHGAARGAQHVGHSAIINRAAGPPRDRARMHEMEVRRPRRHSGSSAGSGDSSRTTPR